MNTRKLNKLLLGTAIVTLAIGVTYACKDFLNTTPQGVLGVDALSTKDGVEGLLIAAYRSLDCSSSSVGSWGCAASNWVWGSVTAGDAHKGSNLGDQAPIFEIETYLWSAGDVQDYLNQKWSQAYDGVARANATLRLMEHVRSVKPGEIDDATAAAIRGECYFLRAHYHFEAYRLWQNIPYYFQNDTADLKKTNVGVDVIGFIVKDLDSAQALLAATPRNGDVGRATKWTAEAYRGRVYAYAAANNAVYWDSAKAVLDSVVTSGPYGLETSFDHVWTAFTNLQNGPETILAFQASVRDGEPSGWNSNWGERLNFPHSGSHFGCCGFHQPSFNLVDFFQVDANGLPLALSDPNWASPTPTPQAQIPVSDTGNIWKGLNFVGGIAMRPVDPRVDWTVGRDRTPYKDWGLHNRSWIRDAAYSGPYSPKKNVQENAANGEDNVGWQATQTNDVNIHIYRYADLLLLLAEADVATGNLEAARGFVNQIRARAGQIAQGCGFPSDSASAAGEAAAYPSCVGVTGFTLPLVQNATLDSVTTPWAIYRIGLYPGPWTDAATALTAVKYERRLELAMEGQHFFDLRRWGDADTVIANYLAVEKNRIPYLSGPTFQARNHLYPIPAIQIELSKTGSTDNLVQNPGW
ncbi:MAG TPA: RagB/SusD family nutrient uptake outer membrane protein [Gemmatimonadales bacterium]|nr:RagB/SusD family nutrient uptake outer membrane protein [Gemmatimonadales bacterium]